MAYPCMSGAQPYGPYPSPAGIYDFASETNYEASQMITQTNVIDLTAPSTYGDAYVSSSIPNTSTIETTTTTTTTTTNEFTVSNYEYFQGISGGQKPDPSYFPEDATIPDERQTHCLIELSKRAKNRTKYGEKGNVCPDAARISYMRFILDGVQHSIRPEDADTKYANDKFKFKSEYLLCGKLVCRCEDRAVLPIVTRERYRPVMAWAHVKGDRHYGRDASYDRLCSRFSAKNGLTKELLDSWIKHCPECRRRIEEAKKAKEAKEVEAAKKKALKEAREANKAKKAKK